MPAPYLPAQANRYGKHACMHIIRVGVVIAAFNVDFKAPVEAVGKSAAEVVSSRAHAIGMQRLRRVDKAAVAIGAYDSPQLPRRLALSSLRQQFAAGIDRALVPSAAKNSIYADFALQGELQKGVERTRL